MVDTTLLLVVVVLLWCSRNSIGCCGEMSTACGVEACMFCFGGGVEHFFLFVAAVNAGAVALGAMM